ncbi:ABC transporter substrate-binding protein [Paenibacillus silvae]|uniref:ABC transporter substrate-binding protein n=1 Tax=Paenibacillus silvae TaxID=1325358 RepID=UPI0020069AD4|nr:ABC transporter substrate-binding protein [Paenibacillus silvae]MCK6076230.1 ABC transporter substrate-binding protein [Paenibacillus silvae]MCK6150611.1 ABC transporter substrate-binding protein [Paenibacillus silvae]MCK6268871.1 ABC transporter substrate-binding protein [Paenibacillus silvae]MCK6270464.1 ABC transporter substrate-binding protein [Paenibacillus silvae]
MSKSQKRFSLVLSLIMTVTFVLSACGDSREASESGGAGNDTVQLIWYTIGTPQKDVNKVMETVSQYTKEKINATVTMKMVDWGDYAQKMQVNVASGEPMDIIFTSAGGFDYVQNARKVAFLELDELLPKYGQDLIKTINPAFLSGSKVDGHNYGIPANKELPQQEVWRFNKTLVDKYKLDTSGVRTLDSLEPLLKTIKENEPGVTPFAMDKNYVPYVPYDYVIQNLPMAVKLDTTDFKIVNILETPEMKEALTTMNKYYKAGYISSEAATTGSTNDLTTSGNWFLDRAQTQPLADNQWSASYGYPVVSTPASDAVITNTSVQGSIMAISANSEYPEKAMEFLNLLNTDPVLRNMVDSGIEGTHYKKVDDTHMENLPESKNYDMPSYSLGNNMLLYLNSNDPDNKWEEFKKFNAEGVDSPILSFNFDASKVSAELTAVQNVKEQYWAALMTGTIDPATNLDQVIEKFNQAGLERVMAEAQSQLDAWRAENK